MKAIKPIEEGAEIFNDYGEIPRSDLLRRYGYVTDNYAPYDVVELPLDAICQAAGLENADVESQPAVCYNCLEHIVGRLILPSSTSLKTSSFSMTVMLFCGRLLKIRCRTYSLTNLFYYLRRWPSPQTNSSSKSQRTSLQSPPLVRQKQLSCQKQYS